MYIYPCTRSPSDSAPLPTPIRQNRGQQGGLLIIIIAINNNNNNSYYYY